MLWFSSGSIIFKNGSKWQYWNIIQRVLKLWETTARFISHLLETSGNHPVHFLLLPVHGAMNHSGTLLWLMLRSPSFYQGANCQVWSSSLDDTWRQRPNQRLPYKIVDLKSNCMEYFNKLHTQAIFLTFQVSCQVALWPWLIPGVHASWKEKSRANSI